MLLSALLLAISGFSPIAYAFEGQMFLDQHCVRCHGAEKQKGGLRLDSPPSDPEIWLEIADRLELGEMPPEDEPRPPASEIGSMVSLATKTASSSAGERQVILRRLNRTQYRNTIRDLLHIDTFADDPTGAFPADDKLDGFDNLGGALQMSDFLMRQYLKVARVAVDRATFEGERPEVRTWTLRDKKGRALNWKSQAGRHPDRDHYITLFKNDERAPGDPRGQSCINCRDGASHDGWYEFTFVVESRGRGVMADEFSGGRRTDYPIYRPEDLHRFEFYLTAPSKASAVQTRPRHLVGAWDLPDNQRVTIKQRVWLPRGWRVEIGFGNGYWQVPNPIEFVAPDYDSEAVKQLDKREQQQVYARAILDAYEKLDAPRIVVHEITETGPHYDQWPPESHQVAHETELLDFAKRAFRRPVTEEEIAIFRQLAASSPEGRQAAIQAMLCSPRFLYLDEPQGDLDDYAIASRLSYFLWNTMPDEVLFSEAEAGRLREPAELVRQVERMLEDSRSSEFVENFVWSWLKLDNTVEMAPDPAKFYDFHRRRLDEAMVSETNAFFRHLLDENLPISNFLHSDFALVNSELARHYGLSAAVDTSAKFQKVSLGEDRRRGGLLGQTAVLAASANGVDTSPVVRGIWVMENLLGIHPAPPPDGVEVPEPDARGALTVRELLAKHAGVASCRECHDKIDPLGFALENFDAIGSWRDRYETGQAVDPSGTMPGGKKFKDVTGLKAIMLKSPERFGRNLTTKLLTYATGRPMEAADRPEIDRIADRLSEPGVGLRDLVRLVVSSEIFLSK